MIPPSLLRLSVGGVGFWLPLFLLWPFALAVGLLLLPFVVLACLILFASGMFDRNGVRMIFQLYPTVCALRGLSIQVDQPGNRVEIRIV